MPFHIYDRINIPYNTNVAAKFFVVIHPFNQQAYTVEMCDNVYHTKGAEQYKAFLEAQKSKRHRKTIHAHLCPYNFLDGQHCPFGINCLDIHIIYVHKLRQWTRPTGKCIKNNNDNDSINDNIQSAYICDLKGMIDKLENNYNCSNNNSYSTFKSSIIAFDTNKRILTTKTTHNPYSFSCDLCYYNNKK